MRCMETKVSVSSTTCITRCQSHGCAGSWVYRLSSRCLGVLGDNGWWGWEHKIATALLLTVAIKSNPLLSRFTCCEWQYTMIDTGTNHSTTQQSNGNIQGTPVGSRTVPGWPPASSPLLSPPPPSSAASSSCCQGGSSAEWWEMVITDACRSDPGVMTALKSPAVSHSSRFQGHRFKGAVWMLRCTGHAWFAVRGQRQHSFDLCYTSMWHLWQHNLQRVSEGAAMRGQCIGCSEWHASKLRERSACAD